MYSVPRDVTLPSLDRLSAVSQALHWTERQLVYCGYRNYRSTITHTVQWHLQQAQVLQLLGDVPAVMDMVADSQDEPGSGGSALFSDISTPTRSWNQVAIFIRSRSREILRREDHHLHQRPRGRRRPTSADFRAAIKEKNKMEMEIGEYQKTPDEMSAAMANLHQEDYGSTIRIQELER